MNPHSMKGLTPLVGISAAASIQHDSARLYVGFKMCDDNIEDIEQLIDVGRLTKSSKFGARLVSTTKWKQIVEVFPKQKPEVKYFETEIDSRFERLVQGVYALFCKRLPRMNGCAGRPLEEPRNHFRPGQRVMEVLPRRTAGALRPSEQDLERIKELLLADPEVMKQRDDLNQFLARLLNETDEIKLGFANPRGRKPDKPQPLRGAALLECGLCIGGKPQSLKDFLDEQPG